MSADLVAVENRLWATADQLWANTGLKPSEFSTPVLGLIFLRYADKRFTDLTQALADQGTPADEIDAVDYQAEDVLFLPEKARFSHLLTLTEGANMGRAIATAMSLVEEQNPELKGVLPRGYNLLPNATLVELLRLLAPLDLAGDAFGEVYEYFLGNFAMKEGQKGGVFSLIGTLDRKNLILRTTHDLLLPKLISGELDVSDLPEPETLAV
jgi:type I restriction enzyme M protein